MSIPFKQRHIIRERWNSIITDVPFGDITDNLLTLITGNIEIDIVELDRRLKNRNWDQYTDDMSLEDFLMERFGEKAVKLLNEILE